MNTKFIAQMIKFHRKKAGLNQKELGDLAQVGKTVVFDLEKGKPTVQLNTLMKILDVLNIKIYFQSPLMAIFEEEFNEKS